ncbi:enoyl-CoA hydratase/isomerase family protein [Frigidibacter sp. MR17.24]|uniref:enoyl-CoA hydratase/isomerase family protein n=1 Tax=Frigidibacter sp. MR17.24 TaxID=3127345 RepID=UPI003012C41C
MIRVERDEGLWRVVIDRADKANALTGEMLAELLSVMEAAAVAPGLRVLVLTGAGAVFSAGADLEAARAGLATSDLWERLSAAVAALPCLTVAALNGTVAGGASGMVLACDLRVAVEGARLFYPVMRLGFLPQPSDVRRLVALAGPARAKMILMAGARIGAEEARAWGLVDRVVAAGALEAAVAELAGDALGAGAGHVAAIKAMI